MSSPPRPPRPWLAALLALLCNGLGHAYAGAPHTAVVVFILWLCLQATLIGAAFVGFRPAVISLAAVVAFWLGQSVLAARAAGRSPAGTRRWHSRPLGLVALYLASIIAAAVCVTALRPRLPHSYYIAAGSMFPTLLVGDLVVALPAHHIERGTVIIHAAPPGGRSSDPLVKRVVAVGGDTVAVEEGRLVVNRKPVEHLPDAAPCTWEARAGDGRWRNEPCVAFTERLGDRGFRVACTPYLACGDVAEQQVPVGHVFVLGDHRDHSADSRVYGPIAERAILGRAAYVTVSFGPAGLRWDRTGSTVE